MRRCRKFHVSDVHQLTVGDSFLRDAGPTFDFMTDKSSSWRTYSVKRHGASERKKEKPTMRAAIFRGAFDIQVEQIPDAALLEPTDAVVQITHACICGTDLWPYRGQGSYQPGWQIGHEWMGIVGDIGSEVRTLKRGDRVIASYDFCDGTCEFCLKGLDSACLQGGLWGFGHEGGQAEAIRARFADAALIVFPPRWREMRPCSRLFCP
jgi:D-arabinose 1-dehydrogenase-like Zn-dependent alcohol dehydrogenase